MTLAYMLTLDRRALLCDLAETYHILSFDAVPPVTLATLCAGLRPDARIHKKMTDSMPVSEHYLMASIADQLALIRHGLFAEKNTSMPTLFTDTLFGVAEKQTDQVLFDSGDSFRMQWDKLTRG